MTAKPRKAVKAPPKVAPPKRKQPIGKRVAGIAAAGALALAGAAGGAAVASTVPAHCAAQGSNPDQKCTPGQLNQNVTQSNIQKTICVTGYTATIRPPVSYTNPLKSELMRSYGLTGASSAYELDHLISLELGGNPTSPSNLWPEAYLPTPGAHEKDKVENYLHKQVCDGKMTLAAAQKQITSGWVSVWDQIKP
jgi:hypothetical protein